jgi:hypothetical protein
MHIHGSKIKHELKDLSETCHNFMSFTNLHLMLSCLVKINCCNSVSLSPFLLEILSAAARAEETIVEGLALTFAYFTEEL